MLLWRETFTCSDTRPRIAQTPVRGVQYKSSGADFESQSQPAHSVCRSAKANQVAPSLAEDRNWQFNERQKALDDYMVGFDLRQGDPRPTPVVVLVLAGPTGTGFHVPKPQATLSLVQLLRTLFVVVAVLAAFIASHATWIQQRHAILLRPDIRLENTCRDAEVQWRMPLLLRLFGENVVEAINVPESEVPRIRALFPESILVSRPDGEEPSGPVLPIAIIR